MPSLIGNKPNQVPSNGDLGTLAFQDSNAVNITGGMVDVSAGTAALPTLGTTGDPNTGVFFPAADTVAVATNGVERVRVDISGNVGVGVIPIASTLPIIESSYGLFMGRNESNVGANVYFNAGFKYTTTAVASLYSQSAGVHKWFTAPSGTAGNAITFTQPMTLHASGGVSIGNTTDPGATNLSVTGTTTSKTYILTNNLNNIAGNTWTNANAGTATGVGLSFVAGATSVGDLVVTTTSYSGVYGSISNSTQLINRAGPVVIKSGGFADASIIGNFSSTGLAVTGVLSSSGLFSPQQATTAGAPAYVKGAIYFDTTLNKLRVGGATGWETITSV